MTRAKARKSDAERRLAEIAWLIEAVDNRCLAADGPVTPTLEEMRPGELGRIYRLATGKRKPSKSRASKPQPKAGRLLFTGWAHRAREGGPWSWVGRLRLHDSDRRVEVREAGKGDGA